MSAELSILQDFTEYPGPRYRADGPFSGELFREEILSPALREAIERRVPLVVILDGVAGYGSSFLDEAFAGLLRHGFTRENVTQYLALVARTPRFEHHKIRAEKYILEEAERQAKLAKH